MCLIFIALQQHADYPVIIAANRDEFYSRPAEYAHFWPEHPDVLAGKDQLAGGTWLGITRTGRFAAVTNFRQPDNNVYASSRGQLVMNFLTQPVSTEHYTRHLLQTGQQYAGFNSLHGRLSAKGCSIHYVSNHDKNSRQLAKGLYGLSNAFLDTAWPKVVQGKQAIVSLLGKPFQEQDWFDILDNRQQADSGLPDTGIGMDKEKILSSRFIQTHNYGTRCSTLVFVDKNNRMTLVEKSYDNHGLIENTSRFSFEITTDVSHPV